MEGRGRVKKGEGKGRGEGRLASHTILGPATKGKMTRNNTIYETEVHRLL